MGLGKAYGNDWGAGLLLRYVHGEDHRLSSGLFMSDRIVSYWWEGYELK